MFYIQQIGKQDCGFTALKVLLANQFQKEGYLYLTEDEEHGSYSFLELIEIAKDYGLTLSGVKYESPEYEPLPSKPFLAVLKISENTSHLVYVSKIKKNTVEIFDPTKGKKTMKKVDFFNIFDGNALIIEKAREEKEVEARINDIKLQSKVLSSIIQVLSIGALIAGMLFINTDSYIFIPIICFTIFVILQIVLDRVILSNLKKVDDVYLQIMEKKPDNSRMIIERLSEYKKTLFIGPIKLTTDIISILFLSAVMIVNNYKTSVVVLITIALVVLDVCFIQENTKKREEEIAIFEKEVDDSGDIGDYVTKMQELHEKVYVVAMIKRAMKYISAFIILLSVIIVMISSGVVSVPFVLIHVIFGITIYNHLIDVASFEKSIEKKKVDYMKLINILKR